MSAIENIVQVLNEPGIPTNNKALVNLVKKAINKYLSSSDELKNFNEDAQRYILESRKALKNNLAIQPPAGFEFPSEIEAKEDLKEAERTPKDFYSQNSVESSSIQSLVGQLDNGALKKPDFQRKFVWSKKLSQQFVRAVLNDVPIANLVFANDTPYTEDRRIYVLDGAQRLTTLSKFIKDEITLDADGDFPKYKFSQLPKEKQNQFLQSTLGIKKSTSKRKFWPYIFRQINKGGMPANSIEIRRAIYDHPLMIMLDEMAENNKIWASIFSVNTRFKGLHALVRAVAMHVRYKEYKKPMEQFLDMFCDQLSDTNLPVDQLKADLEFLFLALCKHPKLNKTAFRVRKHDAKQDPKTKEMKEALSSLNLGMVDCLIHAGLTLIHESNHTIKQDELGKKLYTIKEKLSYGFDELDQLTNDTSGNENVINRMNAADKLANE